jgi:chromosome partitioning protein
MAEVHARRILVVNGKGGCGKTTIATNLAVAYASAGHKVALIDHDAQASSSQWHEQRASHLAKIHLVPAHQRVDMYQTRTFQNRLPFDIGRIVVDTPSAVSDLDIDTLLKGIDIIVVPILPSSIDIRAGSRFIAQLLTHRAYKLRRVPVGVIANRVHPNSHAHSQLLQFLECLDVTTVATFRETTLYTRLASQGRGVADETGDKMAQRETRHWRALIDWIERSIVDSRALRGPQSVQRHATPAAAPKRATGEAAVKPVPAVDAPV